MNEWELREKIMGILLEDTKLGNYNGAVNRILALIQPTEIKFPSDEDIQKYQGYKSPPTDDMERIRYYIETETINWYQEQIINLNQ